MRSVHGHGADYECALWVVGGGGGYGHSVLYAKKLQRV